MTYLQIVDIIMIVIGIFLSIYPLQYGIMFIPGIFLKPKKFPQREEKLKYAVIIAARNEEKCVGSLVDSIRKSNYPQDKLIIFVLAHNCTDKTAEVAKESGAVVYEYNNPKERTKGYALKKMFEYINDDYGINSFDGYHVFDADNIVDKNYFTKMNDAFLYYERKRIIMGFRNSKNYGENTQTALYGCMYVAECRLEDVTRTNWNITSRLIGSGFVFGPEMVENGWDCVLPSDDVDFTAEQVLKGEKVMYCHEAMYYDEHPTNFKAMWRQRLRWTKGVMVVGAKRWNSLMKNMFRSKKAGSLFDNTKTPKRVSTLDLLFKFTPMALLGLFAMILNIILVALAPLFGASLSEACLRLGLNLGTSLFLGYGVLMVVPLACYILERKSITGVSFWTKVKSIVLFPIFVFWLVPMQAQSLFTLKKLDWKPIVHKSTANFETFNNPQQTTKSVENVKDDV